MAAKGDRRRDQNRLKQKKKREAARKARKARVTRTKASPRQAAHWPVVDAWISERWHEPGVEVTAIVSRRHADDTFAWCAFEVDLADGRILSADHDVGVSEGHVQQEVAQRAEDETLVTVEPEAVAQLVRQALAFAPRAARPDGFDDARALLGDLDPAASPYDFVFGDEADEDTEELRKPGLLARLFGRT